MKKKLPLHGLKVLDLTQVLSGPFATLILSDLGANVTKVEKLEGDDSRKFGPIKKNKSSYFISLNRGKKSIMLNLKENEDKIIFEKLLKKSDVLIENFSYGVLKKLGFSWTYLKKKYPKIIYAKISGFGETGPYKNLPAYDIIVQAMGGIMSITGNGKEKYARVGSSIGDIVAGLYCVIGIVSALRARSTTEKGMKIDISMLDCQVAILENAISRYSIQKKNPFPLGTHHPNITPFGAFETNDRAIVIAAGNQKLFEKFCLAIGKKDLILDKKFINNEKRNQNFKFLKNEIESILIKKKSKFWIQKLNKFKIPCSTIDTINDVIKNPQILSRNMILDYYDKDIGRIKVTGNPIKFNDLKENTRSKLAPELDADRKKILKNLS